jgi:Zn-dependent protease with chaperone function
VDGAYSIFYTQPRTRERIKRLLAMSA